jgi:ribonuclease-3
MKEMRTLEGLEEGLGVSFHDQQLLRDATTHDSAVQERLAKKSYERLEFLGDAILGQAIAELIYQDFPTLAEGKLSRIRAAVVNNENLASVARNKLDLGTYLLLGKGEKDHGGSEKTSILAGSLEAVLGATHLDQGAETVCAMVRQWFGERLHEYAGGRVSDDYKGRLQEFLARVSPKLRPVYAIDESSGPHHRKEYSAQVVVDGRVHGTGRGTTKKAAQQKAARQALEQIEEEVWAEESDPRSSNT